MKKYVIVVDEKQLKDLRDCPMYAEHEGRFDWKRKEELEQLIESAVEKSQYDSRLNRVLE